MSSHSATIPAQRREAQKGSGGSSAVWKVVVLLLGIAVGVLAITAVVAVQAADEARDEATAGSAAPATAHPRPLQPCEHGQYVERREPAAASSQE